MMIDLCHEASLPQPEFELRQGSFVVTMWRDWLTDEVLQNTSLNDHQKHAIRAPQQKGVFW